MTKRWPTVLAALFVAVAPCWAQTTAPLVPVAGSLPATVAQLTARSPSDGNVALSVPQAQAAYLQLKNLRVVTLYSANGAGTGPGPSSTARVTMMPPDSSSGLSVVTVPANMMGAGNYLDIEGEGNVSGATVSAGNFNVLPYASTDGGATKTAVGGTNIMGVTLGVAAPCYFRARLLQVAGGILLSGYVQYGTQSGMTMTFQLNASKTVTASDPTVDRYFGVDGQWDNSNAANFESSTSVVAKLWRRNP